MYFIRINNVAINLYNIVSYEKCQYPAIREGTYDYGIKFIANVSDQNPSYSHIQAYNREIYFDTEADRDAALNKINALTLSKFAAI